MNILTTEGLTKGYGERNLFNDLSFAINDTDRIGLIGVNGAGKSTLLAVLAGVDPPDAGRIIHNGTIRIEYLRQSPTFEPGVTVLEHIFSGETVEMRLLREYEALVARLEKRPGDSALLDQLMRLNQKMDQLDIWGLETEAKRILTQLGILDFSADVSTLSGGQRKRIALAGVLIRPADLLILDEPTNHIDHETVDWLERHLATRKGAVLMVTHDRYLLDRVANRMFELYQGTIQTYEANYTRYLEAKEERAAFEEATQRKRQNLIRRELAWLRRGARARSTKQKARIDRFEQLTAQEAPVARGELALSSGYTRLGRQIIELEGIRMAYGTPLLIDDFNYVFLRDDRIGIIGPNGIGKSTLLGIITGRLAPDAGTVTIGETVRIGLYAQENEAMGEGVRVIDAVREVAEYIETRAGKVSASEMLERFLFPSELQYTEVDRLSGGERRRLELLKVLMRAPNVLILDEPTNDLDLETLTVLEAYLDGFEGVVVTVSHDRYFLDRVVDRIFAFRGEGVIRQYEGGYSDFAATSAREMDDSEGPVSDTRPATWKKDREDKFSYSEQQEFDAIESVITSLEERIIGLEEQMAAASQDYVALQRITADKENLEVELDRTLTRWEELTERYEAMQAKKS